jgi:hypothetical protein
MLMFSLYGTFTAMIQYAFLIPSLKLASIIFFLLFFKPFIQAVLSRSVVDFAGRKKSFRIRIRAPPDPK